MADRRNKKASRLTRLIPPAFALAAGAWAAEHHDPNHEPAPPTFAPKPPRVSGRAPRRDGFARISGVVGDHQGPRPGMRVELIDDDLLEAVRLDARSCGHRARPLLLDPSCELAAESLFELFDAGALAVASARSTVTGPTGWFAFEALAEGRYAVLASASTTVRGIELGAFGATEIEVALPRPVRQEGVVRTFDGEPISGAEILAIEPQIGHVRAAQSEVGGRFVLEGLDPSLAYHLLARAAGYAPRSRARVVPGQTAVAFELEEAAAIAGQVTRQGHPVEGARVEVDALLTRRTSDGAGRFRIDALTPGFHVVRVTAGRGEGRRLEIEAPSAGTRALAVELEPVCDLVVRVTDEIGTPVSGADVRLLAVDSIAHRAAETDAEGTTKLELMTLGTYEVDVRPPLASAARAPGIGLGAASWTLALRAACSQRTEEVALSGRLTPPTTPEHER